MKVPEPSPKDALERRSWHLWALTFVLVIALAISVPLFYVPLESLLSEGPRGPGAHMPEEFIALVGLVGLALIFCLYTALKQRELDAMRRRLEDEEREKQTVATRLSELSALFQVSTSLNLQLRLDDILEIIVRRVVSTLNAQQASIMILDAAAGALETRASYGLESEFARNARRRLGEGIAGWVAQRGEAVQLDSGCGGFSSEQKHDRNITSALSLPLRVGERCIGVLNVNRINHPETFQGHHLDMLRLFADHVGAVIERAEAMEQLGTRARELEAVNARLAEVNRLKDVFLSTASHELKTPLTSVIGYAELLDENEERLSHAQRSEFLSRLRAEAVRLLGLIEDILDLTRIESGKMALRRVHMGVNEIARAATETTHGVAAKRGIELETRLEDGLPDLSLDEVKIRQVIVNLLANAVKFSPEGARVLLVTRRDGADHLRVEVTDHGRGIPPEDATHIFELFGQGAHGAEAGGLGIGLHLVRRIVELHGGYVGMNSRVGEGSTFWVRLPVAAAGQDVASEALRQAA
jgi:signal transduction histidine kinase